ncbi:MAG: hypothetical protein H0W33_01090 [Gammaproteobacteria bacterium]|nr:hypothetical protein [Gammaproteobacteria bacterium]
MKTTNVTLKIDADLARNARVMTARRGSSLSRLLADQLEALLRSEKAYEVAKRRALKRLEKGYELNWRSTQAATSFMTDKVCVDTNVLFYAHDSAAGENAGRPEKNCTRIVL